MSMELFPLNPADKTTHGAAFALKECIAAPKRFETFKPHVDTLLACLDFPQFMRFRLEEKIHNRSLTGEDMRMYFNSCGLPIPADLRGI